MQYTVVASLAAIPPPHLGPSFSRPSLMNSAAAVLAACCSSSLAPFFFSLRGFNTLNTLLRANFQTVMSEAMGLGLSYRLRFYTCSLSSSLRSSLRSSLLLTFRVPSQSTATSPFLPTLLENLAEGDLLLLVLVHIVRDALGRSLDQALQALVG